MVSVALKHAFFSLFFFFFSPALFVIHLDRRRVLMQLDFRCRSLSCVWLVTGRILDLSSRDCRIC